MHLTWSAVTGLPALLVRKDTGGACQVLVTAYPDCMVAEHRAGRPDLVPSVLDSVAEAYEAALEDARGQTHLASKRDVRPVVSVTILPARPVSRAWLPHAVAAAALTALIWPAATGHVGQAIGGSGQVAYSYPSPGTEDAYLTDVVEFNALRMGNKSLRVLMPKGPLPGQDRPPCREPAEEVNGGCWLHLKQDPPCKKNSVEHDGGCYFGLKGGKPMELPNNTIQRTP
ncbi:hypothetical protein [Myxococcus landrumensis]|uniref:Uncharacterized protein n=1 Tax=Myxococcus landrumensis TaxID=2813577 RepID=A0ABX7N5J1_9BACT|nr:hypothetical protein [Myxococcus landrumus]QSQ14012.1 hypothetical protein JY572_37815 [Myxococcus landrumus]